MQTQYILTICHPDAIDNWLPTDYKLNLTKVTNYISNHTFINASDKMQTWELEFTFDDTETMISFLNNMRPNDKECSRIHKYWTDNNITITHSFVSLPDNTEITIPNSPIWI